MPRGGSREGAGRPPTFRRMTLDAEASEQLRALLALRQAEAIPDEPHLSASQIVRELITDAWWQAIGQHEPERPEGSADSADAEA